jgi:Asp-tRNA(Asn)/Glu-tRNA(Gln) amidotransferase A subunit family amidase
MTDPARLDAAAIAKAVRNRRMSAETVVNAALEAIERRNPALNCFTAVLRERALEAAASVDERLSAGGDPGPLAGVPFGVKNLFDVRGLPTLAGSRINRDLAPARADAVLVRRLEAAGAVLVGTQHMDEYAYGFTTENSHYGPGRNPHDLAHVAGGSSGGSAAAVAAGLVPLSLASDTNGSIRVPS